MESGGGRQIAAPTGAEGERIANGHPYIVLCPFSIVHSQAPAGVELLPYSKNPASSA